MNQPLLWVRRFLSELRRRNVYRVAVTYVIVGFFVIEGADLTLTRLGLPSWTVTLVIVLVGLGFPIALVLAWALEMTPEGIRIEEPQASEEVAPTPSSSPQEVWLGLSILVLLLLGAWWVLSDMGGGEVADTAQGRGPAMEERSIAVLPFEVSGSGAQEWRDGMVTVLSLNLDGAAGLRAIADRTVFAAWKKQDSAKVGVNAEQALRVARDVGAKYAVVGSAVQLGEELRFSAEVRRTQSGKRVGQVNVEGPAGSIMALTDRLSRRVLDLLLERSEEQVPSVDLASITTSSLEALKAFLEGERHLRAGDSEEEAIEDFEAAMRADSTFALPYMRLGLLGLWHPVWEGQAMRRAYELSGQLPERERRLVEALYMGRIEHRTLAAAERLRQLAEDYPDDPSVWHTLGEFVFHEYIPRGVPEFEAAHGQAVALDPGNASYYAHFILPAFYYHRDSAMAARRIERMPEGERKRMYRLHLSLVFGTSRQRERALSRLDTASVPEPWLAFDPLEHPKDHDLMDTVLRKLLGREDPQGRSYAETLVINHFERGQAGQLSADLERLDLEADFKARILALSMSQGMPVPDSMARSYLAPENLPTDPSVGRLLSAGISLIEQGRGEMLGRLLSRIREAGGRTGRLSSEELEVAVQELRGYRAWKGGRLEEAARHWGRSNESWPPGALWRGDLFRELGQLERAEGWYLAAWEVSLVHERLGRLYEQMGRPEKAQAAYERFVEAWKNADPELQDPVTKARVRFKALGGKKATE